jgi:serine/threonine protein kinase
MNRFTALLFQLIQGKTTLEVVRAWLAGKLKQPEINHRTLLAEIDAAVEAGLLTPMAASLRKQIEAASAERSSAQEKTEVLLDSGRSGETERAPPRHAAAEDTGGLLRLVEDGTTQLDRTSSADDSATVHATGRSWTTGSNFADDADRAQQTIGAGSVLKQRFELIQPIGEGGMGTVYKARDLLKVEARDRNPYIAVKLLSGDFRRHPEAFIALQREASKAQRLAHPNIATVYDFDRDGQTVYMTMELMEGEVFAKYIKTLPAGGLAVADAMALIGQLCSGLSYAHKSGLVHSDLKPGNAFLNRDGRVKLLDFGIARASTVRHDLGDGNAETTMFDPVSLGALTPAYATLDMFEGKPPDPRDDIYALACVAYELLSGRHPFDKLSAVKVKEKGLKPKPLAKLGKRQNRALLAALALDRAARTATVDRFWEGIAPRETHTWRRVAGSILAAAVLAGIAYGPVAGYLKQRRNKTLITALTQEPSARIPASLKRLETLTPTARRRVLNAAKDTVIGYFDDRAEAAVDADRGHYDFPAALAIMRRAAHYYPDSAQVLNIQTELKTRRNELVNRLTKAFNEALQQGEILPGAGKDMTDIVHKLAVAAPHSPLLHDPRLAKRYADAIRLALKKHDMRHAERALKAGLAYAPDDPELQNLADQLRRKKQRAEAARQVATLEKKLAAAQGHLTTLSDYAAMRDNLAKLARLDPDDPVLARLEKPLRAVVRTALQADMHAHHWQQAETTLRRFAPFFATGELIALRAQLSSAEIAAGFEAPSMRTRLAKIDARRHRINKLLAKPRFTAAWRGRLLEQFKQLIALKQTGETWLEPLQSKIAKTYIGQAKQMIQAKRFNAAGQLLGHAQVFAPHFSALDHTRRALASARQTFHKARAEKLKAARIEALKNQLVTQANAGEIAHAKQTLATLAAALGANSPYVRKTGPAAIAHGYLRLARARARNGDYQGAITLVNAGLALAPALDALKQARTKFSRQAERARLIDRAGAVTAKRMTAFKRQIERLVQHDPQDKKALEKAVAARLAAHIEHLADTDAGGAHRLLHAAKHAFPANSALAAINLPAPRLAEQSGERAPQPTANGSRPCTAALAGYGRKGRAECFDMIAPGVPGPTLIVIPAGHGFKAPFAIGKYEVSAGQYNHYCHQTPGCTPLAGDPHLPAAGLSFRQAKAYAAWLTVKTHHHYAVPTRAEWRYAARAGNAAAVSNFNCRVTLGEQTLKGLSLVDIHTGEANPWGLVNYVGNVEEWVDGPKGPEAVGGDYQDNLAKCSISLTRQVDDDNIEVTGLRVVRAMKKINNHE